MKANKTVFGLGVAAALALAAWLPGTANAQEQMPPMKGGEHMIMLNNIKTQAQAEELKPGDTIAMVCAKCKSVMVQHVSTGKGQVKFMTADEKHLCPGCHSTMTIVGTGKHATDEVKHVCSMCGSDSAFCCATKPGEGATKGMEKEEEKK
jgi:RNA polymerase subunit RPABC4/transcription elongation factor Spt4